MFNIFTLSIWVTIALMLPTYIDGLTQAFFKRESNNILRVTSGIMAGIGGVSLMAIMGKYLGDQILLNYK